MSALFTALLAQVSEDDLKQLAQLLAPFIDAPKSAPAPQRWLSVTEAAEYLSCPTSRIYALCSARRIPFSKDGSRTLFDSRELDAWVHAGGATRP